MKFRDWFEKSGYSVAELAETLGVTRQSVYNWLAGTRTPTLSRILKLNALSQGKLGLRSFAISKKVARKGGPNV